MSLATRSRVAVQLQDNEVMTGRVVKLRWLYGGTSISEQWVVDLQPSGNDPRGGYGVIGLYVDELFPNDPNAQEKEVVAATLAGDVFFLSEAAGIQRFRTSVPGAAGFYNSILARDLNGDGIKELYISGSMGLHRFVRLSEQGITP